MDIENTLKQFVKVPEHFATKIKDPTINRSLSMSINLSYYDANSYLISLGDCTDCSSRSFT